MKLFIISDIHGSFTAFEKALVQFEKEEADLLVICGDYLNHGPRNNIPQGYDTKKLAEKLNYHKEKIICVRGNCDSEVDQMMLDFPVLAPITNIILPKGTRVFVHHGHLYSQEDCKKLLPKQSIVVSGHTHIPLLEKSDDIVFLNPGSISIPKADSAPGYAIINSDEKSVAISIHNLEGEKLKSLDF